MIEIINSLLDFRNDSTLREPDAGLLHSLVGGNKSASGVSVTEEKALQIGAVYACVRVLSSTFAALPLHLMQEDGQGNKSKAKDHPLFEILHMMPNEEMLSYNHRQLIMSSLLMKGTSYNEYARDKRGRVREIFPLVGEMKVTRNKAGILVYDFYDGCSNRQIQNNRMWRISGYSHNGITGKTPISIARETLGQSIAASEYGARNFANSAKFSGILKSQKKLTKDQRHDLMKAWNESFSGIKNAGKTGLVHNGADYTPISMTSADAQFLETMKFQRSEIAGLFGVPPHMIGDLERATFSNIEHQSINFVIYSLLPHLKNFEQSVYRDLLTPNERKIYRAKFSVEGLLRGDSKARAAFYKALFNMGVITINELRELEDMNSIEGGDHRYMQTAMGKIDETGNIIGNKNENSQQTSSADSSESES